MRNKLTLLHFGWLLVALGMFVAGRFTADVGNNPGGHGNEAHSLNVPGSGLAVQPGPAGMLTRNQDAAGDQAIGSSPIGMAAGPLSEADIKTIAKEAFSDPNPLKRELAFARLLEGLTPENAAQIREQMREGRASGDQWRLFQYAWGAVDGPGAIAVAQEIERKDWRERAVSEALSGWASADPQQAIDWLGELPAEERGRFQDELVGGLADHNIDIASNYVLELAAAGDRRSSDLMGIVAGEQLRKEGPLVAASWAERLPDGAAKGSALDRVANAYVDRDPAAAAAWAAQFATADYGSRVIEEVGDEWAERDPAASVAWLESLPDSKGTREGFESALGEWVRKDPTTASQYLIDMPASETKDMAVNGFVSRLAWEDPQSAIAWAETIQQEETRMEALTRVGYAYYRRDRDAATEWLATSGLSEDAQKKIIESRSRGRRG